MAVAEAGNTDDASMRFGQGESELEQAQATEAQSRSQPRTTLRPDDDGQRRRTGVAAPGGVSHSQPCSDLVWQATARCRVTVEALHDECNANI